MKRKAFSVLLTVLLLVSTVVPARAQNVNTYTDLRGHWAETAVLKAVKNGLLDGTDSTIKPDEQLTRTMLADMLVRAFGATVEADLSGYTDIAAGSREAGVMAKAVQMGAFKGNGGMLYPNALITREEVFLAVCRVLRLSAPDDSSLQKFSDGASMSAWARRAAAAMVQYGYVHGADGRLNPSSPITRGEAAQLMDSLFPVYLSQPGTYTSVPEGNVMINVPGVILRDTTVKGMIIVGDGVGTGNCTVEGVKLTSIMLVRGGGLHTTIAGVAAAEGEENAVALLQDEDGGVGQIVITNAAGSVVLNSVSYDTRLFVPVMTSPPPVVAMSPGVLSGLFGQVISAVPPQPPAPLSPQNPFSQPPQQQAAQQSPTLTFQDATVGSLTVQTPGTTVAVQSSTIQTATVSSGGAGTTLSVGPGGSVGGVTANAPTTVSGSGAVGTVTANASNVTVGTQGTTVTAAPGITGVTAGGSPVAPGGSLSTAPPPQVMPVYSSNADLKALAVNGTSVPNFSRDTIEYSLTLPAETQTVTVTATSYDAASIAVGNTPAQEGTPTASIPVHYGANHLVVTVTAQNGNTKHYYIYITVTDSPASGFVEATTENNSNLKIILTMHVPLQSSNDATPFSISATGYTFTINNVAVADNSTTITLWASVLPAEQLPERITVLYVPSEDPSKDPPEKHQLLDSNNNSVCAFSMELELHQ